MQLSFLTLRVSELLDYTSEELTGRNMYSLIHGQDVIQIRKCHLDRKYYEVDSLDGLAGPMTFFFNSDTQGSSYDQLLQIDKQVRRFHLAPDLCNSHLQQFKQ